MAYTVEDVDKLVGELDRRTAKLAEVAGSVVKRRSAERDVLSQAESGRDLLVKAIKGDKNHLNEVFGGTCERIGRLRNIIDSVEFADMGADDERWDHLKTAIATIEKILRELGSFKPWQADVVPAPESIKYKNVRRRVSPGRRMTIKPEFVGGACTFSFEGAAPDGLEIASDTGVISGAVKTPMPDLTLSVIAKNDAGEVRTQIQISIAEIPPKSLAYPDLSGMLTVGEIAVFQPVVEGGACRTFSIEPALPDGMVLEESTGIITGSPRGGSEPQDYVIKGANAGGAVQATVHFGARTPPPVGLTYPSIGEELAVGHSVCYEPEIQEGIPSEFTVEPALPDGLVLDRAKGEIRGSPKSASETTEYVITASNLGGATTAKLQFAVRLLPPTSVSYPDVATTYTDASEVSLSPAIAGGAPDKFTVDPALPEGLVLSTVTGHINGIPTRIDEPGSWTITAENAAGATSTVLTFTVTRAPPSNLQYPSLEPEYSVGREVAIQPSVSGEVDDFSVSPELPQGLELNKSSGVISGIPQVVSAETVYKVTAKNDVGTAIASLAFSLSVKPPSDLAYPSADPVYTVFEKVNLAPSVGGGPATYTVEPDLPYGLQLDTSSGVISGAAGDVAEVKAYTITASNDAGSSSVVLEFKVNMSPPKTLSYPTLSYEYAVGEHIDLEPVLNPGEFTFKVDPPLPSGLELDEHTGVISGSPTEEVEEETYTITAKNSMGTTDIDIMFLVAPAPEEPVIDTKFAELLEEVTEIADIVNVEEPSKQVRFGDWMIWMVHRAFLDDPSLTDFNFNHCKMPLPHEEWRVAPKLMKALETNTHIETLSLAQSNLQKPQGHELAKALKTNCSLKILNIESNKLDSSCLQELAEALACNTQTSVETLRVAYQAGMGRFYGRPVEMAFGEMMEKNQTIIKLGLGCDDAHWRNTIDRCLLRNNDWARRRRKVSSPEDAYNELPSEDRTLSRLQLRQPPSTSISDVFSDESDGVASFKGYLVQNKKMPTPTQLQSFAKNLGRSLKYAALKPTIEQCRARILDAAKRTQVTISDSFDAVIEGTLSKWEVKGTNWTLELMSDGKRLKCQSPKEPGILFSDEWQLWLQGNGTSEEG